MATRVDNRFNDVRADVQLHGFIERHGLRYSVVAIRALALALQYDPEELAHRRSRVYRHRPLRAARGVVAKHRRRINRPEGVEMKTHLYTAARIAARENAFHGELRMIVNDPDRNDRDKPGLEGLCGSAECSAECAPGADGLASLSPWSDWCGIYCRDGKVRRVPAESLLFRVADGVSGGVDGGGVAGISEAGGFPLTTQKEGRAMLLKGYGNAIVPEVASEFIGAFMEA